MTIARAFALVLMAFFVAACSSNQDTGTSTTVRLNLSGGSGMRSALAVPLGVSLVSIEVTGERMASMVTNIAVNANPTLVAVLAVPNGPARTFFVQAKDANGYVHFSGSAVQDLDGNAVVIDLTLTYVGNDSTPPSIPTGLTVTANATGGMNVSWTPSTDDIFVAGYNVYRDGALHKKQTGTSLADTGLVPETQYCYMLEAFDLGGNISGRTASVCDITILVDVEKPTQPTGMTATAIDPDGMDLIWNASTDNVGVVDYQIYRNGVFHTSTEGLPYYYEFGLTTGVQYCYYVVAVDAAGNKSLPSNTSCDTPVTLGDTTSPSQPTGMTATASSPTSIDLTWTASTDNVAVTGYDIYRDGSFLTSSLYPYHYDTGLTPSTNYCYYVMAKDAAGNSSAASTSACDTTTASADSTPPSVPTGVTVTPVSSSELTVSWTASTDNVGVTGYEVYRDTVFLSNDLASPYADSGLATDTQYCYTVLAFDAVGNKSAQSASVCNKTLALPKAAWAFGSNTYGQLGIGNTTAKDFPVPVDSLTDVRDVSTRWDHNLAVLGDGTVWAWGYNEQGQVGDGTMIDQLSPVQTVGMTNAIAVAAASFSSLALDNAGDVFGWGDNTFGTLGDGTSTAMSGLVQTILPLPAVSLVAGSNHAYAILNDGSLYAWGYNGQGQVGDGTTTNALTPKLVSGLPATVANVASGSDHVLALLTNGALYAWGDNAYGQLGIGNTTDALVPVQLTLPGGATSIIDVATKVSASFALDSSGQIWGWGDNLYTSPVLVATIPGATRIMNTYAFLSDGSVWFYYFMVPAVQIEGGMGIVKINEGSSHTLLLADPDLQPPTAPTGLTASALSGRQVKLSWTAATDDIHVYQYNIYANSVLKVTIYGYYTDTVVMGLTPGTLYSFDVEAVDLLGQTAISTTPASATTMSAGLVDIGWAWGRGIDGQLGIDSMNDAITPTEMYGLANIVQIDGGDTYALIVLADGTLWSAGDPFGQPGDEFMSGTGTPVQVTGISGVINASAGPTHSVALLADGSVWTWGSNAFGQLGLGNTTVSLVPMEVMGLPQIAKVSAGDYYTMALDVNGDVWTWGYNVYGQLGIGNTTNKNTPQQPMVTVPVLDIDAGHSHAMTICANNQVHLWGFNGYGQIGDGTTANWLTEYTPLLYNIKLIAAGYGHSIAIDTSDVVYAWGYNGYGQLGIGNTTSKTTPIAAFTSPGYTAIRAGDYHNIARLTDGTLAVWGLNNVSQLGLGDWTNRLTPTALTAPTGVTAIGAGLDFTFAVAP
jgi:alpha-tubulin suppressor-like RCC1 family protein